MERVQFTEKQLGYLYDFYKNELNSNDYYEENGIYFIDDYQNGITRIGNINDVIKDFIFLKKEYEKESYKMKNATAIYTGGNIYIYYGQLENGLYFRACDEWECIEICDADTSTEEADYIEFYEKHSKGTIANEEYTNFWNDMLLWIIHNEPDGNYSSYELEKRIIKRIERKEGFRTVKFYGGMTGEFELISTDAPNSVIKAQLTYTSACQEDGEQIENPYAIIEAMGYVVNVLGNHDDFDSEDMETAIIDAEFDYYEF